MAKNTATYDGYEFDLNQFPFNGPVTGGDIKGEIGKKTGQSPEGAVAKVSPDGRYEVIGADEPVQVKDGDRFGLLPTFETAGEGGLR
jgi:hypothetical protein